MRDSDPVDSLLLMRVGLYFGPACFFILTALWTKLLVEGTISTGVFVVLVVANVPITLAGIALIYRSIGGTATLLANTLTAAGDIPPPRRQFTATNALIDLYRRTGRRDRLTVELARFAERYRGTPHGEAAARELKELKAEARG